ncbi:MAG: lactate utilization protein [Oceanospirillaceae bacterium]|nr:lactate utilization protein [Oceanospirillaceae bacterium]
MSRAEILGNIRRGLKRGSATEAQRQAVQNRLQARAANLIPARAQLPAAEQVALFKTMAREAAADLIELDSLDEVPSVAADWLRHNRVEELVCASDATLTSLNWAGTTDIRRETRVARAGDLASLTSCFAGIAETGTLMLHSQAESPTTLNFLPDNHLVILRTSQIVGVYEEAWQRLREATGGDMPRTVNMITGPSRSADIEQKLQMGAHGPRNLVILLVRD